MAGLLIVVISGAQSAAPVVTNAGGGSYSDPNSYTRYIDWSIGELTLIHMAASADNSVIVYQGVLQPCTEKPGFTPFSAEFTSEHFKLFPNPTIGKFELNFFLNERGVLDLDLTDVSGKLLESRTYTYYGCCRIIHYDISTLPAGVYFIVATLRPDPATLFNTRQEPRRSGIRVIKMNQ